MTPKWLFDTTNLDDDSVLELKQAVLDSGHEYREVGIKDYYHGNFTQFPDDDCVIFYGTLNIGQKAHRMTNWQPGTLCNKDTMKCSYYYPLLGEHLLNSTYFLVAINDSIRLFPIYCDLLCTDRLFVRPDSGFKSFNGDVITKSEASAFLSHCKIDQEHNSDDNTLCIFADYIYIDKEYRLIVVDGIVVASSQYMSNGKHEESPYAPEEAIKFAQEIISNGFMPSKAFVIDIADVDGEFKVVEINSFSCSGFYQANKRAIVDAMNVLAIKMWEENQ